jgi:hypothetical protein
MWGSRLLFSKVERGVMDFLTGSDLFPFYSLKVFFGKVKTGEKIAKMREFSH